MLSKILYIYCTKNEQKPHNCLIGEILLKFNSLQLLIEIYITEFMYGNNPKNIDLELSKTIKKDS